MNGSLLTLREALAAIQTALAEDALESLPPLVHSYHQQLHSWMAGGTEGAGESLRALRDAHHQVITQLQHCQARLRAQMQAERHGAHAARTYLSMPT